MRYPNDVEPERLERIILQSLWPSSSHPVRLYGRFARGELTFVFAPDLAVSWTRAADQSAEDFEVTVSNAILRMRGLPCLDDVDARGRQGARALERARLGQRARAARAS
jgi:hypothetical protein